MELDKEEKSWDRMTERSGRCGPKAVRSSRDGENRKVGVFVAGVMFNVMGLNLVKLQK